MTAHRAPLFNCLEAGPDLVGGLEGVRRDKQGADLRQRRIAKKRFRQLSGPTFEFDRQPFAGQSQVGHGQRGDGLPLGLDGLQPEGKKHQGRAHHR